MIIVSDTSPLSNLAVIGQISLLPKIYSRIIIPKTVAEELVNAGNSFPQIQSVVSLNWIEIREVKQSEMMRTLLDNSLLDAGEAEAIILALELKAEELLIDERIGRYEASQLGIPITGLLGILLVAKRRNLISQVKPIIKNLISEAGFRVSPQLHQEVLQLAGESN